MSELKSEEKIVVAADLHGYYEPLEQAVDYYGDTVDRYVLNGDLVGAGPSTARVLDIAREIDADITIGNWELYLLAGLLHEDEEMQQHIQATVRVFSEEKGILDAIARSYGVPTKATSRSEKVKHLRESMLEKGHLQMLARAAMYYEDRNFIAIHAGLTEMGWLMQKQELYYVRNDLTCNNGEVEYDEPPQIVDLSLAHQDKAFKGTHKTVVTGHAHTPQGDRISANGARVRIGSRLELQEPLYVWQNWNQKIHKFSQK